MQFDLKGRIALVGATAALAIVGCGGGDGGGEDAGSSGDPLSEEEYAMEVQAVLASFGEETLSVGPELTGSPEDIRPGVKELQTVAETAVDDLNAIQPPETAVEGHEALTDAMDGFLADVETLSSALESGDESEAEQAILDFQQAGLEFEKEFAAAVEQLNKAGIEPPTE